MKRLWIVLMCVLLLAGCKSIPDGMEEETYDIASDALGVVDAYLDGKMTAEDAYDQLLAIYENMTIAEKELWEETEEMISTTEGVTHLTLSRHILSMGISVGDISRAPFLDSVDEKEEMQNVLGRRNDIALELGVSARK